MSSQQVHYQHAALDPAITLGDNESLSRLHVRRGGSLYGRVLFTEVEPMVLIEGQKVTVSHCIFEDMNHA